MGYTLRMESFFNHEGPTRAETFVTRKITRAVAAIHLGFQDRLFWATLMQAGLGPCTRLRRGMWRILQHPSPTIMSWRQGKPIRCANSSSVPLQSLASKSVEGTGVEERGFDKKPAGSSSRSIRVIFVRRRSISFSAILARRSRNLLEAHDRISTARIGHGRERLDRHEETWPDLRSVAWISFRRGPGTSGEFGSPAIVAWLARRSCAGSRRRRGNPDGGPSRCRSARAGRRPAMGGAAKPDVIILAAAKVGGILANDSYPADFFSIIRD